MVLMIFNATIITAALELDQTKLGQLMSDLFYVLHTTVYDSRLQGLHIMYCCVLLCPIQKCCNFNCKTGINSVIHYFLHGGKLICFPLKAN